jgi:hypothetical protein
MGLKMNVLFEYNLVNINSQTHKRVSDNENIEELRCNTQGKP